MVLQVSMMPEGMPDEMVVLTGPFNEQHQFIWPNVLGAASGKTARQSVAEWEPRSGTSAFEVRVEDGAKAKEMPKARGDDQERPGGARRVRDQSVGRQNNGP